MERQKEERERGVIRGRGKREKWDEGDKHEREGSGTDLPLILINKELM